MAVGLMPILAHFGQHAPLRGERIVLGKPVRFLTLGAATEREHPKQHTQRLAYKRHPEQV